MEDLEFSILPLVQMKEDGSPIDIRPIRAICAKGLSKSPPEDRIIAWGLLSGLLPDHAEEWGRFRRQLCCEYRNFMREFQIEDYENKIFPNTTGITNFGLPDNHIMELIHGDIIRTGHHIHYLPDPDLNIKYKKVSENDEKPFTRSTSDSILKGTPLTQSNCLTKSFSTNLNSLTENPKSSKIENPNQNQDPNHNQNQNPNQNPNQRNENQRNENSTNKNETDLSLIQQSDKNQISNKMNSNYRNQNEPSSNTGIKENNDNNDNNNSNDNNNNNNNDNQNSNNSDNKKEGSSGRRHEKCGVRSFGSSASIQVCGSVTSGLVIVDDDDDKKMMPFHFHMRRLERLLYIFAKCNGTLSYMQGFNEIASVLYYASSRALNFFYNDYFEVEVFVFYLFQRIFATTELSELFTTIDQSSLIHKKMAKLMQVIKRHMPESCETIQKMSIQPLQFCYRRLNLLFAQDQDIPNLVVIWDAIFAHFGELVEFEFYLILGQIKLIEPLIDADDYSQTMIALQKLNVCDPKKLVDWANHFWMIDHEPKTKKNVKK